MKKLLIATLMVTTTLFFVACGGNSTTANKTSSTTGMDSVVPGIPGNKGIGKFTKVELSSPLDDRMVANGQAIFNSKCLTCHKLDELKLVGPGLKDVTKRRTPEWIMNFVSYPDTMFEKDATAKAMLDICHVKMPNLKLADEEVRAVLEYLRRNDGEK